MNISSNDSSRAFSPTPSFGGSSADVGSPVHDANGPCLQIQIDLSAMLDGELEARSVRRVMVHSDVCPGCRSFLQGIRHQLSAHQDLYAIGAGPLQRSGEPDLRGNGFGERAGGARELRRQLIENRYQLARILYEMGRGFVLMGLSPNFSREVAREPVPIPDLYLRGCSLLDEVQRLSTETSGAEWVRAKSLFSRGEMSDPAENVARGKRLLREALMLRSDFHEARIYLGHAYHVAHERELAQQEFRAVLAASCDPLIRAFALENLGNVYLEGGKPGDSLRYFHELVDSGVIAKERRFFTTYFNLALAYGILEKFRPCGVWLGRLHGEFPHKRRLIRAELASRTQFAATLGRHPLAEKSLTRRFPEWFPLPKRSC